MVVCVACLEISTERGGRLLLAPEHLSERWARGKNRGRVEKVEVVQGGREGYLSILRWETLWGHDAQPGPPVHAA
jgi:hypothetical protein